MGDHEHEADGSGHPEQHQGLSRQLLDRLRDRSLNDAERIVAVKLGGDLMNVDDEIASELLTIVGSAEESDELRASAAIALGPSLEEGDLMESGFDDDEAVISGEVFSRIKEELQRIVLDETLPEEVRRRAMEASVRAPEGWHAEQVRAAMRSDDLLWQLTGVFSMGFVPGFEAEISKALESEDPRMQREAILAAGHQSVDEAFGRIRRLACSETADRSLRLAAVEALGGYDSRAAHSTLEGLSTHEDEEIADLALYGLSFMVDPDDSDLAFLGLDDDEEEIDLDEDDDLPF